MLSLNLFQLIFATWWAIGRCTYRAKLTRCSVTVCRFLGLAHDASRPFPHDPLECDDLLEMLRRHTASLASDVFDQLRDGASLAAIVRFDTQVRATGVGSPLRLNALSEIDNVRPAPGSRLAGLPEQPSAVVPVKRMGPDRHAVG